MPWIGGYLQVKGTWPKQCETCICFLKKCKITHEGLLSQVSALHEQSVDDLVAYNRELLNKGGLKKLKVPKSEAATVKVKSDPDTVKEEPVSDDEQPAPVQEKQGEDIHVEAFMNRSQLMALRGLQPLPKGEEGKKIPAFCTHCNTYIEARGRAKVWQHVRGQEHRRRWRKATCEAKPEAEEEREEIAADELAASTKALQLDFCKGLRLNSDWGRSTRLGGDLRSAWDEFPIYQDFEDTNAPKNVSIHAVSRLDKTNDWILQHRLCHDEVGQVMVRKNDEGDSTCQRCIDLASDQKFIHRVSSFLQDLHGMKLLWHWMFAADQRDSAVDEIKSMDIYQRRCSAKYNEMFSWSIEELRRKMRSRWWGRAAMQMNPALQHFHMTTVKPCLDVEPGKVDVWHTDIHTHTLSQNFTNFHKFHHVQEWWCSEIMFLQFRVVLVPWSDWECDHRTPPQLCTGQCLKSMQVENLMRWLHKDETVSNKEIEMVRAIISGDVARHPALHGLMCALLNRIQKIDGGKETFRNRHRSLVEPLSV